MIKENEFKGCIVEYRLGREGDHAVSGHVGLGEREDPQNPRVVGFSLRCIVPIRRLETYLVYWNSKISKLEKFCFIVIIMLCLCNIDEKYWSQRC